MRIFRIHTVAGKVLVVKAATIIFSASGGTLYLQDDKGRHVAAFCAEHIIGVVDRESEG